MISVVNINGETSGEGTIIITDVNGKIKMIGGGSSTPTTSNVLIDGGSFTAPAENVLIDAGAF
jgi:hypothetical protein